MLQSPSGATFNPENISSKSYKYVLFSNMVKRSRSYEEVLGTKYRLERTAPNMQQVIHTDMARMKTNKVYDRRLNRDLNGPKGLSWQCKQELQRLRSDERGVERDLLRLNRDLGKLSVLPAISRSPSLAQTSRLSSIAEEHPMIPMLERPKPILRRSASLSPNRNLAPLQKRSSMRKTTLLPKNSFQQLIAKTSDDRQQHAHIIEQQKRLVEQRLKQFLH